MAQQIIRDFRGNIIANIEIRSNGDKIVRNFHGQILGTYNAATNITRDFYGNVAAKGECLGLLIK